MTLAQGSPGMMVGVAKQGEPLFAGLRTSADDLILSSNALFSGRIVSPESLKKMDRGRPPERRPDDEARNAGSVAEGP